MSTRAKAFFGFTVASAIVIIPWVHYVQNQQRDVLREGPLRDAERRKKAAQRELTPEQQERALEYEEQKRLRSEYSLTQEVSKR